MLASVCALGWAIVAGAAPPSPLPVGEVTVFSDRARVTRRGELALAAEGPTRIAVLPATLDTESVRLEAEGATVKRVEVRRAGLDELPRTEAEQLIRDIEAARDAETALTDRRATLERERSLLMGVRPSASPQPDPKIAPATLDPTGWKASIGFFDAREATVEEQLRALDEKILAASKKTRQLREKAGLLLSAGGSAQQGWLVEAWIEGRGSARLALTYVTHAARWYPAYDVRFNPGKAEVEIGFVALASQQTGEDWVDAKLSFSTAVPATTATLPKLLVWKIGDKDRFIPTPVAKPVPPAPAPPRPVLADAAVPGDRDQALRQRLSQLAVSSSDEGSGLEQFGAGRAQGFKGAPSSSDSFAPEESRPMVNESLRRDMPAAPPPPPAPPPRKRGKAAPSAPPAQAPAPEPAPVATAERSVAVTSAPSGWASGVRVTDGLFIGGPGGFRAPSFSADLPAALAGGYDFVYPSARRETVRSGPESRRVALHQAKFPASARLAIYPALRKSAYLVADVTNASEVPLLQGDANLFVGADLQGQARIPTTAAGEKLTLPLGVDEGVQIERNVNVVTKETGFVSKDDVTTYEVVVELLNPRSTPVDARIVDQLPLSGEKTVEVKLDRMDPWALHDKDEGSLEWRLPLKPGVKQVIRFAYTVTRPRGAQMRQW